MSVFDSVNLFELECIRAEKNISDDYNCKHIITRLEFAKAGKVLFSVRSSYTIYPNGIPNFEHPVKISADNLLKNIIIRERYFSPEKVTKEVEKEIDMINTVWDNCPNETKRVY